MTTVDSQIEALYQVCRVAEDQDITAAWQAFDNWNEKTREWILSEFGEQQINAFDKANLITEREHYHKNLEYQINKKVKVLQNLK